MNIEEELDKCETIEDLTGKNGLIQKLVGGMIERMLEQEMEEHLGYKKNAVDGNNSGNSRNGKSKKTFKFPLEIKRLIYTTNAVESLHRQFRKVTKTKSVFPSDQALLKMLFLASRDITKKWTLPVRGWKEAISYFGVAYEDRLAIEARA